MPLKEPLSIAEMFTVALTRKWLVRRHLKEQLSIADLDKTMVVSMCT